MRVSRDITIREYSERQRPKWNAFVAESNNGTMFHDLDFLDYHPKDKFQERHLMFYKGEALIGVMPAAVSEEGGKTVMRSPYGGSFGGIVEREGLTFADSKAMVVALVHFLDENFDEFHVTSPPSIYSAIPSCYTEFNMLRAGFEAANQITSVIRLDGMGLEGRTRTAVRKAEKEGIRVATDSDDLISFYKVLQISKAEHGVEPTHTLEDFMIIREILPRSIMIDMAYIDRKSIAGALYFVCNPWIILLFYVCYEPAHGEKCATSLLLYHGIKRAGECGFRYLDLGTTTMPNGDYNPGLFMFKEGFGARGHMRTTYTWRRRG
jgi:lipid II:glycine glycyltransferase (peptidoglycan interpeptide bridge formation enzyme)